jgi:hypothetical protein
MTKDPFHVNEVQFEDIYDELDGNDITKMIMSIDVAGCDGYYINTEIDTMRPEMRKQMLNQIMSLITTYKRLNNML